jgi:hypothetical protein
MMDLMSYKLSGVRGAGTGSNCFLLSESIEGCTVCPMKAGMTSKGCLVF